MSDRQNDVLAAIDAETAKCICGRTIPTDGPSLDYCSLPCQYRYAASLVGTTPDYENQYQADDEITDGRAINAEVARELARPAPYGAAEFHSGDAMRQRADQEAEHGNDRVIQTNPLSSTARDLAETIRTTMGIPEEWANRRFEVTTDEWIPTEAEHERAEAALAAEASQPIGLRYTVGRVTYTGTGTATRLPDGSFRVHGSFDQRSEPCEQTSEPPQLVEDETNGTTRIMYVPNIADPRAPTAGELAAGVTLGVLNENGRLQTETPALLTPEVLSRSLREARDAYYLGYWESPRREPEPPLTGEELRARALAARQNRGTGPKPGRRIPPRDLRR